MDNTGTDEFYTKIMSRFAKVVRNPIRMSHRERFSKEKWLQWYNDACERHEEFQNLNPPKKDALIALVSATRCINAYDNTEHASALLSSLRVITLPELNMGERHFGRVLHGQLCVRPSLLWDIVTLMEDSSGRVMRVQVVNTVSSILSPGEVNARFPEGAKITIKEPLFESDENGFPEIKVDNPEDLLINDEDTGSWLDSIDLEVTRTEGNRLFAGRDWMGAEAKYSVCIKEALRRKKCSKDDKGHYLDRILVAVYSNRAEARLHMQEYTNASADASKALELDSKHVKSLARKARAAHGLGLYEEACTILSTTLEQLPGDESLLKYLKASMASYEQSTHEKFVLRKHKTYASESGGGSGSEKKRPVGK